MRDVKKADGQQVFRQRILRGLHPKTDALQQVTIPVTSVINYDIPNLKLEMNDNYNFMEDMNKQLGPSAQKSSIDFSSLGDFGSAFTYSATQYMSSLNSQGDKTRLSTFFKQLSKIF